MFNLLFCLLYYIYLELKYNVKSLKSIFNGKSESKIQEYEALGIQERISREGIQEVRG